jgi:23S rRNA G2069 N7-methylase RlmK/C1962 C5-methylase RlmI
LLQPGGTLFASTNAAGWEPDAFLAQVRGALKAEGQRVVREAYAPQPPDFPISRAEPAYLKTVWIRVP